MSAPTPLGREAGIAVRWNAAAAAVSLLAQLGQLVLLARWLSPAEFGIAAVALTATGFATGLADLGMTNALVQKDGLSEKTWASAWWISAIAGTFLGAALVMASFPLGRLLRLEGLVPLLGISALSLPFFGTASVFQARLQHRLLFRRLAIGEMLAATIALAVTMGWLLWRPGPAALIAGQATLAIARFALFGVLSELRPEFRLRRADLRPLSAFGAWQAGERTLSHAAGNLDRVLVAALLGPASAGYYAMASQIALRPMTFLGPFIARTLLPLLARMQGDTARMSGAYLRAISLLSFCAAGVFALLFGTAGSLLPALLGAGWEPAVPVLRVFAALGFLLAGGNAVGNLALALGRAGTNFWLNVAVLAGRAAAVTVGARFGVTGAAIGMLAITVMTLPFDFILPRLWLRVPPAALVRASCWALVPAAAAAGGMTALAAWMHLTALAETAITILVGGMLFFTATYALQRERLAATLRELRGKFAPRR